MFFTASKTAATLKLSAKTTLTPEPSLLASKDGSQPVATSRTSKPRFQRPLVRALQSLGLSLLLLAAGCSSAQDATAKLPVTAEAAKPKQLTAQLGQLQLTGRKLQGYEFVEAHMMALAGLTRWQDKLVFGVLSDEGNGNNYVLKALNVDLAAWKQQRPELSIATQVFNKGVLKPETITLGSYSHPSTDGQYLYFGTKDGFTTYQDQKLGPVNRNYGFLRLAIDAQQGRAYAYSNRIKAVSSLENGQLKDLHLLIPNGDKLGFSILDAVVVGPDHNLYVAGTLPQQNHKLAIFTPDFKRLALFGTNGPDTIKPPGRAFPTLGLTSKFIFSWKQDDFFTQPAQLCVWSLQGTYQGKVSSEQVLGPGWQPVDITSWDENTLLVAAAKITKEEQAKNAQNGQTYTKRDWTYGFFLVQLTGEPAAATATTSKENSGPANVSSTAELKAMGTGVVTQDTEAVSLISRSSRYQLQKGERLTILRTLRREQAGQSSSTWYVVEIDASAHGRKGLDRLELPETVFKPEP